ncbi:MAG TPA: hemolysin family protein [Jatrophihabitantaceae bacterium]|nr:hemolysin family protein [Jatrophihabitantaceae bacterium]
MTGNAVFIVSAVVLAFFASLFAGAEAALSRVSRVRVDELVREGRRGAQRLQQVLLEPPRYLNLTLLLRVVCELTAAVLVTVVCLRTFSATWQAVAVAVAVMVVVSYVGIGVTPRTLGRQHAEPIALASAVVLVPLAKVLGPLPALLILIGNAITPGRGFRDGPFASEAELRELVDLAEENRVIEAEERRMVHSVFELGDTIVREVMVPRTDMVFIERSKTLRQALSLALRSGFSRIPVVGENEDDVVGIAYLKDIARRTHEYRDGESTERVESVMRPATFVPDSKPADELLREMQSKRIHMAVVVDEYGGTAGIVTIEDILEEIVGEISDEYDSEAPQVERLADGSVRVTARLPVEELAELFRVEIEDEDVETVGGLLGKHLGRVPIPGATVVVEGLSLTAESAAGRRNQIGTVLVRRVAPDRTEATAPEADREHAEA